MNINYELYRIFYEVAITGNITKASQNLNISQPAVTKQIKNLENQLGGELFIRTKKGVILTENGQEIFNYIKQAMHCFENAELQFSNLKKLDTGSIKIGISTMLCRTYLLPFLKEFHQQYPNINITIYTDPTTTLVKLLKEGKIDIIISKDKAIEDNELYFEQIGILNECFIAPSSLTELQGKIINLQDLEKYPILLPKTPSTTRSSFLTFCKENNISLTSKIEIASSSLLADFVSIGLGIGLVTKEFVLPLIESNKVFIIKTKPILPKIPFSIITLNKSIHSFSTNQFISLLQAHKKPQ